MEIRKEFIVTEVRGTRSSNAPLQLVLEEKGAWRGRGEGQSRVTLDEAAARRQGIPVSLDLVGRTLMVVWQSRSRPIVGESERVDWDNLGPDDLVIKGLRRTEEISFNVGRCPPMRPVRTEMVLRLETPSGADGIHPYLLPCPFYEFVASLTEAEYAECRDLPPNSVFDVKFLLQS